MDKRLQKGIIAVFLANAINVLFSLATNFLLPKFLSVESYAGIKEFQLYVSYVGLFHFGFVDGIYLKYGGKTLGKTVDKSFATDLSTMTVFQLIISCVTLFYQNGTNEKTKSAFAAVLITMTVLFFFIYMVVWRSEAGGLNEIQAAEDDVLYYNMNLDINMRNVATDVIILSTLGAVLDMALTVTTSVYEVSIHKPEMKLTELVESGMQIGREVIGTTVNTSVSYTHLTLPTTPYV